MEEDDHMCKAYFHVIQTLEQLLKTPEVSYLDNKPLGLRGLQVWIFSAVTDDVPSCLY